MNNLLENLKVILEVEIAIYKEIDKLAEEKKQVIISNDLKNLEKFTEFEEKMVFELGKAEKEREFIIEEIAKEMGKSKNITVTEMLESIPAQFALEIKKLKEELLDVVNSVKEKNEVNNLLIQESLNYVNFNLELFKSLTEKEAYGNSADGKVDRSMSAIFDKKG